MSQGSIQSSSWQRMFEQRKGYVGGRRTFWGSMYRVLCQSPYCAGCIDLQKVESSSQVAVWHRNIQSVWGALHLEFVLDHKKNIEVVSDSLKKVGRGILEKGLWMCQDGRRNSLKVLMSRCSALDLLLHHHLLLPFAFSWSCLFACGGFNLLVNCKQTTCIMGWQVLGLMAFCPLLLIQFSPKI